MDQRKLYLEAGYPSLFAFMIGELKYSESSTLKRIQVCRVARKLPLLYSFLEGGRISLTALSRLALFLTQANHETLLMDAEGKPVREVEKLIVRHFPKKDVEDKVRSTMTPLSVGRVHIHFTTDEAFVKKLEDVRSRLSHRYPQGKLSDIP